MSNALFQLMAEYVSKLAAGCSVQDLKELESRIADLSAKEHERLIGELRYLEEKKRELPEEVYLSHFRDIRHKIKTLESMTDQLQLTEIKTQRLKNMMVSLLLLFVLIMIFSKCTG